MKRRNPPCAAPPLSSFPMGKKLDTTQRGASQGGFLLLSLFTAFWTKKVKNFQKTKASHFGPSVYHYKLLKGKPTELERLMEAEVTN